MARPGALARGLQRVRDALSPPDAPPSIPPAASPATADDDWALWHRAIDGDRVSAERLVRRLTPQALGLAQQLLGRCEAAEDAVQDAFMRLWRSRPRDTGQARLATYFNTIVLNRCRSAWSTSQRETCTDPDDLEALMALSPLGDEASWSSAPTNDAALGLRLRAAVAALPPRQRMAIAMWAYAEASVADIAQALDIDPNAAHQLLHRAKRRLRDALNEDGSP
jgi:RNA polymerase sigma-70 factor (ECF subfamily)